MPVNMVGNQVHDFALFHSRLQQQFQQQVGAGVGPLSRFPSRMAWVTVRARPISSSVGSVGSRGVALF
jgi:hypothetical protein